MIIPNSDFEGAKRVGERIRQSIYDLNLEHKNNLGGQRVTISVGGISLIPGDKFEATQVIELADQALYRAKQQGRNQVCIDNGCDQEKAISVCATAVS